MRNWIGMSNLPTGGITRDMSDQASPTRILIPPTSVVRARVPLTAKPSEFRGLPLARFLRKRRHFFPLAAHLMSEILIRLSFSAIIAHLGTTAAFSNPASSDLCGQASMNTWNGKEWGINHTALLYVVTRMRRSDRHVVPHPLPQLGNPPRWLLHGCYCSHSSGPTMPHGIL